MDLDDYRRLKKTLEDLRRREDRLAGALDQARAALKEECGLSADGAAKELVKLKKELARVERAAEAAVRSFLEKWSERLAVR